MKKISRQEASEAINRLSSTEDGQIFLAVLCAECGFMRNAMSMDDPNKTQVLAAMRGVYGKIRNSIRPEHLIEAEYRIQIIDKQPTKAK